MYYDLIVVGAGPSGIMAAIQASKKGKKTCIIDQNSEICKKLKITGGGRCNITSKISISDFFEHIPRNSKFLKSCFSQFTNNDLFNFLHELGEEIIFEEEKVYLKSNDAKSLISVFLKNLKKLSIDIFYNAKVIEIIGNDIITGMRTKEHIFKGKYFILATGGKSYSHLGSDGDLLQYIREVKILPVEDLRPSLVAINILKTDFCELAGVSISNLTIKIKKNKKIVKILKGELLFTHRGFSGPVILNASSYLIDDKDIKATIDFLPKFTREELFKHIAEIRNRKKIIEVLSKYLPKNFLKILIPDLDYKNTNKKIFNTIVDNIKEYIIEIESFEGYNKAIITRGGISCSSIDPKTMKSKFHQNLWIVGEMLDVDGLTGGYNLQIAFSTGYVAGNQIGGM